MDEGRRGRSEIGGGNKGVRGVSERSEEGRKEKTIAERK